MSELSESLLQKYNGIILLCTQSKAYYRHLFCGTKNSGKYLKIVTRKGMYFTESELQIISRYVTHLVGTNSTISQNKANGTLSITLYN